MVDNAIKKGVSKDLVRKWQNQLQVAKKNGSFAFTVISVLTSAFSNLSKSLVISNLKYNSRFN